LKQRYPKEIQPVSGPEKAFGQALREVRLARKMSQEQLAFESEFDRTYISLVERGIRSPTIRSVVRLAEALGAKPSEILSRMEALLGTSKRQRRNSG